MINTSRTSVYFLRIICDKSLPECLEVQRLLMPIVVELPPRQLVILENIVPELAQNGFEVEPFGPKTIAIKTAPAILKAARSRSFCANCSMDSSARLR